MFCSFFHQWSGGRWSGPSVKHLFVSEIWLKLSVLGLQLFPQSASHAYLPSILRSVWSPVQSPVQAAGNRVVPALNSCQKSGTPSDAGPACIGVPTTGLPAPRHLTLLRVEWGRVVYPMSFLLCIMEICMLFIVGGRMSSGETKKYTDPHKTPSNSHT